MRHDQCALLLLQEAEDTAGGTASAAAAALVLQGMMGRQGTRMINTELGFRYK